MSFFSSPELLIGQALIGIINGSLYALLSLGLAVIFGMLRVINFTHGAQYMAGAMLAWLLLRHLGLGYWPALIVSPLIVAAVGVLIERLMLKRLYHLDQLYGLLLTFGLALIVEGYFSHQYGTSGQPYPVPASLSGGFDLDFMFLPYYRIWVVVTSVVVCAGIWWIIERTKYGTYLRAATDNPVLVQALGVNVPLTMTVTYALGAGLAAFAGVLAAPILQVSPIMGQNILIVVFAVIVIGGMGSILGSIVTGLMLGLVEAMTKVVYPQASGTIVFVLMAFVLLVRPAGLFGRDLGSYQPTHVFLPPKINMAKAGIVAFPIIAVLAVLLLPHFVYPVLLVQILCFALLAAAYNLVIANAGLVSFGHAAFFGSSAYFTAYAMKAWGTSTELGLLVGVAVTSLLGLIFGALAARRQGIYFAMITLALAQLCYFIFLQSSFTGGEDGIQGIPRGNLFGLISLDDDLRIYYFVAALCVLGFYVVYRVQHSPFGNLLRAIRDNESRMISLGYDTTHYKLAVFIISAALSGLAGGLKVLTFQVATLTDVNYYVSAEVILMVLLGGVGTFAGPIVGAAVVVAAGNYLATSSLPVSIMLGVIFVVCTLCFKRGLVGETLAFFGRHRGDSERLRAGIA